MSKIGFLVQTVTPYGIISVDANPIEKHCPICGTFETSQLNRMFNPDPCEADEACANCDFSKVCDSDCEYYEYSLLKALKDKVTK